LIFFRAVTGSRVNLAKGFDGSAARKTLDTPDGAHEGLENVAGQECPSLDSFQGWYSPIKREYNLAYIIGDDQVGGRGS